MAKVLHKRHVVRRSIGPKVKCRQEKGAISNPMRREQGRNPTVDRGILTKINLPASYEKQDCHG